MYTKNINNPIIEYVNHILDISIIILGIYITYKCIDFFAFIEPNFVALANASITLYIVSNAIFSELCAARFDKEFSHPECAKTIVSTKNTPTNKRYLALRLFRSGMYINCILFRSNLRDSKKAEGLRAGVGSFNFRQYATTKDWILAYLTITCLISFFIFAILWGCSAVNSDGAYKHSDYYYIMLWWHQTKAVFGF